MITASQFWTPERRAAFNAHRTSNRYTAHWLPDQFRRMPEARPTGGLVDSGPHQGFRLHEKWPQQTNYMRSCRHKGDKEAQRILDHHGWYADSFQSNLIYACAIEIRIPRRMAKRTGGVEHDDRGRFYDGFTRVRWVEATESSDWGQICIARGRSEIHDNLKEAIRSADRTAELAAEEAREDDAKDQAEQETNNLNEENSESEEVIQNIEQELKTFPDNDAFLYTRGVLVERIQAERAAMGRRQARIAALKDDPWLAVPR